MESNSLDPEVAHATETELGAITVLNTRWKVFVGQHDGQFRAGNADYGYVYALQHADLDAKVRKVIETGKVKVAVPFTTISEGHKGSTHFRRRVATGIHAGNGNLLTSDGQKTSQLDRYALAGVVGRPFTPEDEKAYAAAVLAIYEAKQVKDALAKKYAFPGGGLQSAVSAAIRAAREAAGEVPGAEG